MSTLKVNTVLSADTPTVNITDGLNVTGVSTVAALNTTSIVNDTPLSNRNIIINGAMTVSQRGTSFTDNGDVSANAYTLDRFKSERDTDGAATITQSGTSPDGFTSSLKYDITTADTSLAASQYAQITYKVEARDLRHLAYGTSAAKTITLSFYVRSNKTGNYNFVYEQEDNGNKLSSHQYTINSADTWERKVITTTGDTAGVINNDGGAGFKMKWGLAYGSTFSSGSVTNGWSAQNNANFGAGQGVNLFDSTSNEWYLTGVQLEIGSVATPFEHRSFADELRRCQRYFYKNTDRPVGMFIPDAADTDQAYGFVRFPVPMRGAPTVILADNNGNTDGKVTQHGAAHNIAATASQIQKEGFARCTNTSSTWNVTAARPIVCGVTTATAEL